MVYKPPLFISGGVLLVLAASLPGPASSQKSAKPSPSSVSNRAKSNSKSVATALTGEQLFRQQCVSCHGAHGEGTEAYPRALAGSQSVEQLAKFISQNMPPGPVKCPRTDSPKVAAYIYDAFYSPIARERNRPARVALSRLTVRQYKNAVADLVDSFRPQTPVAAKNGLQAEYFKARRFSNEDRVIQRVDQQVNFNFRQTGPTADFDPHQFSIRWVGSVVAPDTGIYEFVIHTDQGFRLWINDPNKPLIDAWVKSGNGIDFRESIYLVGGRSYPIRLEFSKSTQGVDDTDKQKDKPIPKASVSLAWKQPHLVEEVIPSRCLVPANSSEDFVVTTPFPPDDRSRGYERGDSVSEAWDEATTSAALETADYIIHHLQELAGTTDDPTRLKTFCRTFVQRAQRRPLDDATAALYVDKQFTRSPDPETAVKRVVLLTLQSPRFLYREIGTSDTDPYSIASKLSFTLWDSMPDDTLMQAAASGNLKTRAQIEQQAQRMVADPRAWYKERDFFHQWLKIDQYPDLAKDSKKFPNFSPEVATDLRTSLDLTLQSVVCSEHSDYRELLLTDKMYINGRLAPIYGVSLDSDAPFQPVELDPNVRSGILTHPYILSSFAYTTTSSPIHRGVLLARNILGRTLNPPPAAFAPTPASLHPDLTTRQRVSLQTKPTLCMSCHGMINPLGFTLERFDAIGRVRSTENGKPVDATGLYEPRTGPTIKFGGARDLARYIANSDEAHSAFVEKLFQYMVKQPVRAYGPQALPGLRQSFQQNGYNIRQLVAEIATESALPRQKTSGASSS